MEPLPAVIVPLVFVSVRFDGQRVPMRRYRGVDGTLIHDHQVAVADVAAGTLYGLRNGELVSAGGGENVIVVAIRERDRAAALERGGGAVHLQLGIVTACVQGQGARVVQGTRHVERIVVRDLQISGVGDSIGGAVQLRAVNGIDNSRTGGGDGAAADSRPIQRNDASGQSLDRAICGAIRVGYRVFQLEIAAAAGFHQPQVGGAAGAPLHASTIA